MLLLICTTESSSTCISSAVTNIGNVTGAEVAQLYVQIPNYAAHGMPIRALRGFSKPTLEPGKSQTVTFKVRNKDLAYYSVFEQGWIVAPGNYTFSVGSSSRQLPLVGTFTR